MNILQKYEEYATASTDAPSVYHKYIGAALVGTIMGRRLWYQHGHHRIYPNLWVCLVGQSTWTKKSTSITSGEYLLSKANEKLLYPAKITTEKLYQVLSQQPAGMMRFGELHILLSQMMRDYNVELKSTLTDFYDSPPHRSYDTKGGGLVEVRYPALTIVAGTTTEWLAEAAKTKDICAGFYPRWLFVVANKSDRPDMPIPPPRDEGKADAIIHELQEIQKSYNVENDPSGRMTMDSEATNAYTSLYVGFKKKFCDDAIMGPFSGRALGSIIKLGMINAMASRRTTTIGIEDIEYGFAMAKTSMDSIQQLVKYEMGDTRSDQKMNRILKLVVGSGEEGIKERTLFLNSGITKREYFNDLLKMLVDTEKVVRSEADKRGSITVYAKEFWKDPSSWEEQA